jgi:tRNA pseudouridine65 synthase
VTEPPRAATLPILYQDATLVAVNKPAGMIVHRGWARDSVTALALVRDMLGHWVYPVHRLDRATSGVLIFALSPEIASRLGHAFMSQRVEKRYHALVRGLAPEQALVDHPIAKEKGKPKLEAQTRVTRLDSYPVTDELTQISRRYSWVEAVPLTGRPHQVRRHLKHIAHPIIGDVRYGKGEHNRLFRRRFGLERMALHAASLQLPHPTRATELLLSAPLPADLAELRAALARARDSGAPDPSAVPSASSSRGLESEH